MQLLGLGNEFEVNIMNVTKTPNKEPVFSPCQKYLK